MGSCRHAYDGPLPILADPCAWTSTSPRMSSLGPRGSRARMSATSRQDAPIRRSTSESESRPPSARPWASPPGVRSSSSPRSRDLAHARCSAYVHRRLEALGFECRREVEIVEGRSHGWIDLVAFDRRTGQLLVIEIKTSLRNIGAVERQLGWYERHGLRVARDEGWRTVMIRGWLLCLATFDVDEALHRNEDALRVALPLRARDLRAQLAGSADVPRGRGLALIDPSRRRRDWLLPSRWDGRRSAGPYASTADAMAVWRGERLRSSVLRDTAARGGRSLTHHCR